MTNIVYQIDKGNDAISIDIYRKSEIDDSVRGGIKETNMPAIC